MNNNTSRKFFDVTHPGQRPANATSRPVLPGKNPTTQDPMFHETVPAAEMPRVAPQTATPAPTTPAPKPAVDPATLDPTALLIQAGTFTPPKASGGNGMKVAVILMCVLMVLMAAVAHFMVRSL